MRLKKKKTENLWEINLSKMFLDVTSKAQSIKAKKKKKINKLDISKIFQTFVL